MYKEQNYISLLLRLSMFISFNFVITRSGRQSGQNFYVCITTKYLIIKRGCWDPFTSSTLPPCWPVPSVQWGKYTLFLHSEYQFKMMIRISIIYTFEQYADLPVANKMIKYTFFKCYLLTSSPLFFVAVWTQQRKMEP